MDPTNPVLHSSCDQDQGILDCKLMTLEIQRQLPESAGVVVPNNEGVDEAAIRAAISEIRERRIGGAASVQPARRPVVAGGEQTLPANIPEVTNRDAQIWATPVGMLKNSGDYGENGIYTNWATFELSETADVSNAQADVAFYFYYYNWTDSMAVLGGVTSQISALGQITASAPRGSSRVQLTALFNVYTPQVGAVFPNFDEVGLGSVSAAENSGDQVWSLPGTNPEMLSLPGTVDVGVGNYALFEVTLLVNYSIAGGSISLDFDSGDFQVTCPNVAYGVETG